MINFLFDLRKFWWCTIFFTVFGSCKTYQQNVLFRVDEEDLQQLGPIIQDVQSGYLVGPYDQLQIKVYTNKGEGLIDPNNALGSGENIKLENEIPIYEVQATGMADLPVIGEIQLEGLTISEVNTLLAEKFSFYYKDPFVQTKFLNKRVIVLGATEGKVITLHSDGVNLLEVLALAGGLEKEAKGHNIRLIRGDLDRPEVHLIDLSTIEGMKKANLRIQPNDIIYVEPVRRPFAESLREVTPLLGVLTSILALIVALNR